MDELVNVEGELDPSQQERLDQHLANLRQGDLIRVPVIAILGAPRATLNDETAAAAEFTDRAVTAIERDSATGLAAIVSQTCDIRASLEKEPTLAIAHLVDLDKESWEAASDGFRARGRFAYPEGAGGLSCPVLDIRTIHSIEKTALADESLAPFDPDLSPRFRTVLAQWLARRFARHAFPKPLEDAALRRLRETANKYARDKSHPVGALLDVVEGVWVSYDDQNAKVLFIVRQDSVSRSARLGDDPGRALTAGAEDLMQAVVRRNESQGSRYIIRWDVATANKVPADAILYEYHPLYLHGE